jgi:hypothetical protein
MTAHPTLAEDLAVVFKLNLDSLEARREYEVRKKKEKRDVDNFALSYSGLALNDLKWR